MLPTDIKHLRHGNEPRFNSTFDKVSRQEKGGFLLALKPWKCCLKVCIEGGRCDTLCLFHNSLPHFIHFGTSVYKASLWSAKWKGNPCIVTGGRGFNSHLVDFSLFCFSADVLCSLELKNVPQQCMTSGGNSTSEWRNLSRWRFIMTASVAT